MKNFYNGFFMGVRIYPLFFGIIGLVLDQTFLFWAALAWFLKTSVNYP